jgi:hypothetical protein
MAGGEERSSRAAGGNPGAISPESCPKILSYYSTRTLEVIMPTMAKTNKARIALAMAEATIRQVVQELDQGELTDEDKRFMRFWELAWSDLRDLEDFRCLD